MGSYKLGCTDLERLEKPATDKHCGLVGTILIIRNHISTAYMIKSWRERLSTVDLNVRTSLDQLFSIMEIYFFQNKLA